MSNKLSNYFDLPDGAIPNSCVGVCQYLDADGEMKFSYIYDTTEMPLSTTLGLLELAKHHLYEASKEEE